MKTMRQTSRFAVLLMVVAMLTLASTSVVASDREPLVPLSGHTLSSDVLTSARPAAKADAPASEDPLLLTIVLRRADEIGFSNFLADVNDPLSPRYRRYLPPQQLADRFGPTQDDYNAVTAYFMAKGFTLVEGSANRMTLTISGPRTAAEDAVATRIDDLQIGGRRFFANATEPSLPASIAGKVQSIVGLSSLARPSRLNTQHQHEEWTHACHTWHLRLLAAEELAFVFFVWEPPLLAASESVLGSLTGLLWILCAGEWIGYNWANFHNNGGGGGGGGGGGHDAPIAASDALVLPGVGLADGTGQTIGLVQFDTFAKSDISNYLALFRIPASRINDISEVHVNGGAPLGKGANEVLLDLTIAMTIAQGAKLVVYDAPLGTSFQAVFNAAINGGSTVISNSWAYCENQTTLADVQSLEALFQTAAASGITVFNAAGDTGSTCLNGSPNTVAVPASAPTSTAVGGTSPQMGPGLTYGGETWWDGSASTPPSGQGGFGVSQFFSRPAYQNGFTASPNRSIPDVVANADPASGVWICQAADGGCPSGKWYGGTSMTAPAWAAFAARLNHAMGSRLGAANPVLYSKANTSAFRSPASMSSDFAHVGVGSPNLVELYLNLTSQTAGLPDANRSQVVELVSGNDVAKVPAGGYPADGATEVFVRVQLVDANLNTVPGKTISLTANAGSHAVITPVNTVTTVHNGTAVFKVTNASFENVTLTATDTTDGIVLARQVTIPFVPPVATSAGITAFPTTVANNGTSTTTITVMLQDALGRPSPGKVVRLDQGSGHSVITAPTPAVTDVNGQIQFTATNRVAETVTYTAIDVTDGNLPVPGTGVVNFTGGPSSACAGAITPAPGFTATPLVTGFLAEAFSFSSINFSCSGAMDPVFDANGNMLISQFRTGDLYKLPPQGGAVSTADRLSSPGISVQRPVFGKDGRLYAVRSATGGGLFSGQVMELNPVTGATLRVLASNLPCVAPPAIDPISGDLFFAAQCFNAGGSANDPRLFRISNPSSATPVLSTYATLPGSPNGAVSFAPDGTMFVAINYLAATPPVVRVSGTNQPQPPTITPVPGVTATYWVTVGETLPNGAAKSLIVNTPDGKLRLADITTNPPTFTEILTTGASSGVIGSDRCLYLSNLETIYRIAPTSGICGFDTSTVAQSIHLTPTAATLPQGTPVTLTAQFTAPVAAGTAVQFVVGDTNRHMLLGRTNANGAATVVVTGRFTGSDRVRAIANVDGIDYLSNVGRITWTAGKHTTSLTLNASLDSVAPGQPATLRAALVDTALRPAGPIGGATIQFTLGALSCSAVTDSSGIASCSVTPTAPGNLILTATYAGNVVFNPAAVSETFQIIGPPSTTIATSGSPVAVGTAFTLTATVTGTLPTGTVSFRNELVPLPNCTAMPLTGAGNTRTAQCTVNSLGVGSFALTAHYSGDGTNFPSSATIVQVVLANAGAACGGFTDVDPASVFCPNVEWMKNRMITFGCTLQLYCPNDSVSRLQMAAFMNRLGTATTDVVLTVQSQPGAIDLDASMVVCQTTDFVVVNFPRRAIVDGIVSGQGSTNVNFIAEAVASFDGGVTWVPLAGTAVAGSAASGRWGNVRSPGVRDLDVGQNVRFGLRVSRGGLAGAGGLSASRCNLRTQIGNRVTGYSPLDP